MDTYALLTTLDRLHDNCDITSKEYEKLYEAVMCMENHRGV